MSSFLDIVPKTGGSTSSASEEYYKYKLFVERMGADGQTIANDLSEKDQIKKQILKKIVTIKESSPEWDSLVALCEGERDRFKQCEIITDAIWEKELAKKKLAMFAPPKGSLDAIYNTSDDAAIRQRLSRGADPGAAARTASMAAAVVRRGAALAGLAPA